MLLAAALTLLVLTPSPARASQPLPPKISDNGVMATATTTAAISVYAVSGTRQVEARYAPADDFSWSGQSEKVTVAGPGFGLLTLRELKPGTRYHYYLTDGATITWEAFFTTAPAGAPGIVRLPSIVSAGDGTSICDPGAWDDPAASLTIRSTAGLTLNGVSMPVRCVITARNAVGTSTAVSPDALTNDGPSRLVTSPPNASTPTVRVSDQVLTCSVAYASPGGVVRVAYAWLRDGVEIATGESYTLVAADAGHDLACRASVSNAVGTSTGTSPPVHVTAASPPTEMVDPPADTETTQTVDLSRVASHRLTAGALRRLARGRSAAGALRTGRLTVGLRPGRGRLTVRVLRGGLVVARGFATVKSDGAQLRRITLRRTGAARRVRHGRTVLELVWRPATGRVLRARA